jgi:hypothetical protein|nr:MAG TPA: distal tail protein [Caudoviricetes sp.]
MDLLVEKLDGRRYYLSQYKVLITDFEESAPSVTRNSKQLDQRNGNIDFGGWHTDKTINITGYYRADDMDDEEALREKLYALLSDPDGYYITQLKTSPETAVERPGETSGNYYDKLKDYPSHKRFLVYTEAPEMELVGNVNGTLLYKLTSEFKTMKLPYGETPPADIDVSSIVPYRGTVPCNQLEQGFAVQFTATGSASSLSLKIDDTELTYNGAVAAGDVFMFSGFSYTQNGLSIVSNTNKAYFTLQPDKPNRIACNVPGTIRILGFQNLYA